MIKDISKIFSANIIKMLVAFVTTFLVPKILTVDGFGQYKIFTFYITYIGLTQLGFCDGIYLRYGGMSKDSIDKESLAIEHSTFIIYEIISSAIVIILGLVLRNFEVIMLGFIILPLQMYSFYSFIYQATGQLSEYSKILSISNIFKLLIFMLLIIFKAKIYQYYVIATVVADYFSFFLYYIPYSKANRKKHRGFNVIVFFETCKLGILLMIGNLMYELFLGVDKWFIRFTLPLSDFSYYSFAGQLITAVNMVVTPISMTLYSYISRNKNKEFEKNLIDKLLVFLMLIPMGSYVAEIIIYTFLDKYVQSIPIVEILMISQIFWALNTVVFVNMFKAYKMQKVYFIKMTASLLIAFILDFTVCIIKPSIIFYSFVTMVTSIVWLIINSISFSHLQLKVIDIIYIFTLLITVMICWNLTLWIKVVIYMIVYILMTFILKKSVIKYIVNYVKSLHF